MHQYASRVIYNVSYVVKCSPFNSIYSPPCAQYTVHIYCANGWRRRLYATGSPAPGTISHPYYNESGTPLSKSPSDLPDISEETATLANSKNRRDPGAWLALLNTYLPDELRSDLEYLSQSPPKSSRVRPIHTLPALLAKARYSPPLKFDLLSYLGSHGGRWDSVIWLVKALIKEHPVRLSLSDRVRQTQDPPWGSASSQNLKLEELVNDPIFIDAVDSSSPHRESLDKMTMTHGSLSAPVSRGQTGQGQVWACVACMILEATDLPADDQKHKATMSCAVEIIAHLHHVDALPNTIYTFSPPEDPSIIQKPPTLYLLAYRIMAVLSDSAWKAHDEDVCREAHFVGAKKWYKGHEIPGPSLQPRVEGLGSEIWLELVLWCCVDAGYITEAAWIVTEMAKRKGSLKWRVIDWHSISESPRSKLNWSAKIELEITKSRMNQFANGIGIANHNGTPPMVQMGPRTVSREVILALMDALSSAFDPYEYGQSARNVPAITTLSMSACRTLLGIKALGLQENFINKSIINVVESGVVDLAATPRGLEHVLEMSPTYRRQTKSQEHIHEAEYSAASIGLLHMALYAYSRQSNVKGALRVFHKLHSLVDTNHRRRIAEFAEGLKRGHRFDEHNDENIDENLNDTIFTEVPVYILASFLDLVTDAGLYELGNWILFSNDVDGPMIPTSFYSEEALKPALLRFAEATGNGELFSNISEHLVPPLSKAVLRILLHCQITSDKWDAAEEVLRHLQREADGALIAKDTMVLARAILRSEMNSSASHQSGSRAYILLQDLLQGKLLPARNLSSVRDYSEYRLLTQISRILHSLPGSLGQMPTHAFSQLGRANAPIEIPTEAFNILLEGVVEAYGSIAGRKLWTQWCHPFAESYTLAPSRALLYLGDDKKVVTPSLQTLRVIMRPLTKAGKVRNDEEAELVTWAIETGRSFGLGADEIDFELHGLVSRPKLP